MIKNFLSETLQTRTSLNDEKNHIHYPRILYPMKIVFKGEGEINIFIQKPRKVVASGSTVKEILKEVVS